MIPFFDSGLGEDDGDWQGHKRVRAHICGSHTGDVGDVTAPDWESVFTTDATDYFVDGLEPLSMIQSSRPTTDWSKFSWEHTTGTQAAQECADGLSQVNLMALLKVRRCVLPRNFSSACRFSRRRQSRLHHVTLERNSVEYVLLMVNTSMGCAKMAMAGSRSQSGTNMIFKRLSGAGSR